MDYRGNNKKNFNFLEKKTLAIKSLREVNCFLYNLNKVFIIKKIVKK